MNCHLAELADVLVSFINKLFYLILKKVNVITPIVVPQCLFVHLKLHDDQRDTTLLKKTFSFLPDIGFTKYRTLHVTSMINWMAIPLQVDEDTALEIGSALIEALENSDLTTNAGEKTLSNWRI